ncbi:MAG: class II fructose-bisphosphate aldolase [Acidimicrobiales bacterium]
MTVVSAGGLVADAARREIGVLAFNAVTLEHAEAILLGAERARQPVILAVSHNAIRFHGAVGPLAGACARLAESASTPVGLHLDHLEDLELVRAASGEGFSSVMFDASRLDDDGNRRATAEAAAIGHAAGLWVESELGEIGGKDGLHSPAARTDPDEAAAFVERTGIDALAVAVGTSHAMVDRVADVDIELIGRLRRAVPVPLVMHGSSGVGDEAIDAAVGAGMVKVNIGTRLNVAWTEAVRARLAGGAGPDPRPALRDAREAMAQVTASLLGRLAAAPSGGAHEHRRNS